MKGVVLDFDGVIVQSMEQHADAYRRVLTQYGFILENMEVFRREGGRSESVIRDILVSHELTADPATVKALAEEKQVVFMGLGRPKPYPGAEAMVLRLRKAAPKLGLVTGTRRENLDRLIPKLLPLFDGVLAEDGYKHDKPHPEPYEKASKAIGVPPGKCVALENAVLGIRSAKAAGYGHVVAITTTMPREELAKAGADQVAGTHEEAAQALVAWLGR